jgi:hypothetical protein
MLKTDAGYAVGDVPRMPVRGGEVELEALAVDDAARVAGLGRTMLYRALHPDPEYRDGLPFLASIKLGKCRRVRVATLRKWLVELEAASQRARREP